MSLYAPHSMHQAYGSQSAAAAYMQSSSFYNSPAYGMLQQGYHSATGMYEHRRQVCVCACQFWPHCLPSSIKGGWLLSCLWKETVLQRLNVLYAFRKLFLLAGVILYLYYRCFISFWKQIDILHCKFILIFLVCVRSRLITETGLCYPVFHPEHGYSPYWLRTWWNL